MILQLIKVTVTQRKFRPHLSEKAQGERRTDERNKKSDELRQHGHLALGELRSVRRDLKHSQPLEIAGAGHADAGQPPTFCSGKHQGAGQQRLTATLPHQICETHKQL